MTTFTKLTLPQVKKLIKTNFGATIKMLPNKANPYSPWFSGEGCEYKTVKELEEAINGTLYYQCNAELGHRVAYWIDESINRPKIMPIKNGLPVWRVQKNGENFYCMNEAFAKYINTERKKIIMGYVYTPTLEWSEEKVKEGQENNFFFMDDQYEEQQFLKLTHVK